MRLAARVASQGYPTQSPMQERTLTHIGGKCICPLPPREGRIAKKMTKMPTPLLHPFGVTFAVSRRVCTPSLRLPTTTSHLT